MAQNTEHYTGPQKPSRNEHDPRVSRRNLLIAGAAGLIGVGGVGVGVGVGLGRRGSNNTPGAGEKPVQSEKPSKPPIEKEPEVEVDPYEAQAWGGIEPGLEGDKLVEALSIPKDATPEEAAEKFVADLNYLLMGDCTPEEAKKYADLDPYVYLRDEDFVGSLMSQTQSRKDAVVDAVYQPTEDQKEYIKDTPFEIKTLGDSQAFNSLMVSSKVMYCISYNDETASEPYRLQFEPIHTEVNDGNISVIVNIIDNQEKSGDSVNELLPQYTDEGLSYDLGEHAEIQVELVKDTASGRYKISQPSMELVED